MEATVSTYEVNGEQFKLVIPRDVTERKAAEEELRTSRIQLAEAARLAKMVHWKHDETTGEFIFNDDFYELYGTTAVREGGYRMAREEYFKRFVHPDDLERLLRQIAEDRAGCYTGEPWQYEHRAIRRDGEVIHILARNRLTMDWEGRIIRSVGVNQDITERKRAEEKLRTSALQLADAADLAKIAYWEHEETTDEFIFNDAFYALYTTTALLEGGYRMAREEYFKRFVHPDDLDGLLCRIEEDRAGGYTGGPAHYEHRAIRADGEVIHILSRSRVTLDREGRVIGAIGADQDITERKRAEEDLRESEARLRAILDGSRDAIGVSKNGIHTFVNPAYVSLSGYESADELIGTPIANLLAPERRGFVEEIMKRRAQGEAIPNFYQMTAVKKDGTRFLVEASVSTYVSKGELFTLGILRDITERRRVEEALLTSRLQLAGAADLARIAYWEHDEAIHEFIFNDAFYELYATTALREGGYRMSGDEYQRRFVHPDDLEELVRQITEQRSRPRNDDQEQYEHRAIRRDGEVIYVLTRSRVGVDSEGRVIRSVGVNQDITERKRAEERLIEANRRLEEATARANVMAVQAQEANVAKSDFLANMSHEIRTPMNGVIGMTGLLLDTEMNDKQRRCGESIRSSAESLLMLINDILDFSKIEAGKLDMETLDFDLRALLDDFAATVALRAHDQGLEFICAAAPEVPAYLRGDPGRLRQILTNLTANALKFTQEGEIAIRASLLEESESEAVIRFSVRDTGIGIPADKQARLFQKFTQADASTTRKYGGTGLGLAISKQLVEMMNGEIDIKSEEGRGSEFRFTVRLPKQPAQERVEMPLADMHGVHILVVDDNATNREVLTAQLQSWGVRTEDAPDGFMALKALYRAKDARDPFRIAILDMQMPGLDGVALGRAIKADGTLGTPVWCSCPLWAGEAMPGEWKSSASMLI